MAFLQVEYLEDLNNLIDALNVKYGIDPNNMSQAVPPTDEAQLARCNLLRAALAIKVQYFITWIPESIEPYVPVPPSDDEGSGIPEPSVDDGGAEPDPDSNT